MADPHAAYRKAAGETWKIVTPYRLGIAVGEAGSDLDPPKAYSERGRENYREGVAVGKRRGDVGEALRMRRRIEVDLADHPGVVEIMGVSLDLDKPGDAKLAAKWLDKLYTDTVTRDR